MRAYRAREAWLEGRIIITPHSAYFTPEADVDIRTKSAETMRAALLTNRPQNVIAPTDEERGGGRRDRRPCGADFWAGVSHTGRDRGRDARGWRGVPWCWRGRPGRRFGRLGRFCFVIASRLLAAWRSRAARQAFVTRPWIATALRASQ